MNDLDLLVELFAKAGKPVVEQAGIKKKKGDKIVISAPSFVVDASWMSDDKSAFNRTALEKLLKEMERTGISREFSLSNFADFIKKLNEALADTSGTTGERLARLNIIRVVHNLAQTKQGRQSAAGFGFENFLALFYKGKAIDPNPPKKDEINERVKAAQRKRDNIADVSFGDAGQASIKFLSEKNPVVVGSIPNLLDTIERHGYIDYIVGVKGTNSVQFKHTRITSKDLVEQSPDGETETPDEILQDILSDEERERFARLGPRSREKFMKSIQGRVDFKKLSGKSGKLVQQWMRYNQRQKSGVENARAPKDSQMSFSLKQLNFRDIGTLNTDGSLKAVNKILETLNNDFKDLLSNLQELSERVSELTYSDQSKRKSKAKQAATKAGETKKSAEEIQ